MCKRAHHEIASPIIYQIFPETADIDEEGQNRPPAGMENDVSLMSFIVAIINIHQFAITDPNPRVNNCFSPIILQQFTQLLTILSNIIKNNKEHKARYEELQTYLLTAKNEISQKLDCPPFFFMFDTRANVSSFLQQLVPNVTFHVAWPEDKEKAMTDIVTDFVRRLKLVQSGKVPKDPSFSLYYSSMEETLEHLSNVTTANAPNEDNSIVENTKHNQAAAARKQAKRKLEIAEEETFETSMSTESGNTPSSLTTTPIPANPSPRRRRASPKDETPLPKSMKSPPVGKGTPGVLLPSTKNQKRK